MPRKIFVAGEILTAADVNTNLMDQAVMVFDDSAARTTAIPTPSEGMVTYLKDSNLVEAYTGAAFVPVNTGFTDSETITATDATWSVPTLGSPIVKVTVIGAGGGGGGGNNSGTSTNGGTGGSSIFDAGGAGSLTATGGTGGIRGGPLAASAVGTAGFAAANGGQGGNVPDVAGARSMGGEGNGGKIAVGYFDLSGISTVDVTIGSGGAGGTTSTANPGATGGRGEVIVEYVAG